MSPPGTPAAEFDLDEAFVARLVAGQYPELADLPVQAVEAGWDNAMFRLGASLAVRLPRRAMAAPLIEHEQVWLPQLAPQLSLPVPVPLRVGAAANGYPWRWSIVPWLSGIPADLQAPAEAQAPVFATFLASLHMPAPANAPANAFRGVPLKQRREAGEQRMESLRKRSRTLEPSLVEVWEQALQTPLDGPAVWLHGDLHPRNILVEKGVISAIIDWGDLTSGDCATDLAAIWMLFESAQARHQALSAYSEAASGLPVQTLRRARGWALLFGLMLLDSGLEDNPRNAALGERILRHVAEPD